MRMLERQPENRPSLREVEKYLRYLVEERNYGKMRVSEIFMQKGIDKNMEKSMERSSGEAITVKKKNRNSN